MNAQSKLPSRLHHNAHVVKNLEVTRQFYEVLLGLKLTATWCEQTDLLSLTKAHWLFSSLLMPTIRRNLALNCLFPDFGILP